MSSPTVTWVHNFRCDVILREDGRAIGRRCGFCFRNASMDDGSSGQGLPGLIQFKIRLPEDSDAVAHAKGPVFSKHSSSLTVKLEADFLKQLKPFFEEPSISLTDGLIPISFAGQPLGVQLPGIASLYLALEFNLVSAKEELGLEVRINACAEAFIINLNRHCLTNGIPFLHTTLPISHDALSAIFVPGHVDPLHLDHSEASEQNKNSIGSQDQSSFMPSLPTFSAPSLSSLMSWGKGDAATSEAEVPNADVAAATSAEPIDPPTVAFGDGEL